jgi:phage repressor protein C with HTH and peptisase S24 domain
MLPVLPPETLVIGLGIFRRPKVGKVVMIIHEGKEKIKRIERVEDDKIFVTGDNPSSSTDSNHFGLIYAGYIKGHIVYPRKLTKVD